MFAVCKKRAQPLLRVLGMETESCHSGSVAGPEQEGGSQLNFQTMLDAALTSALSKYDSIGTYFSDGMSVAAVAEMLAQEMRQDEDLRPSITTPFREEQLRKFVMQMVGKSYGLWKKGSCRVKNDDSRGQDSGMAWASIDNYATWVYEQVTRFLGHFVFSFFGCIKGPCI